MERVLADIDADHGDRNIGCPRHGVLLVFGAPCQLRLLAGQEHGRTIPLADIEAQARLPIRAVLHDKKGGSVSIAQLAAAPYQHFHRWDSNANLISIIAGDTSYAIGGSLVRYIGNAPGALLRPCVAWQGRHGYVRAPLDGAHLYANATQRRAVEGDLGGFCVWPANTMKRPRRGRRAEAACVGTPAGMGPWGRRSASRGFLHSGMK